MATQQIRLKLSENGRVVIPAHVRKDLGVESGGEILLAHQGSARDHPPLY